jgi:tetratricopeptide (TPR) repeat protein
MQAGEMETGRRELERSLAIGPTADAWAALGLLREEHGQVEEARAAYDAALALDPDSVLALFQSALLWRAEGNRERAEGALARAEAAQRRIIAGQPEQADAGERLRQILELRAVQEAERQRDGP